MLNIKYKFSGHQTFVFRYGWLEKGVQMIQNNSHGFCDADALVNLGVGKNMIDSIRYWCVQTGLLKDTSCGNMELSDLAKFIFGANSFNDGIDPYLEDEATLWLLHWSLMFQSKEHDIWSTWHLAFFRWNKQEFTKRELLLAISTWIANEHKVSITTLERDIDCFVRNYAGTKDKSKEENFDSPFLDLELITHTSQDDLFRFNIGTKRNLPVEIVGYSLLKFMNGRDNINVHNCLYDIASPGQIFKLNESSFIDYILELEKLSNQQIQISETAGLASISYTGSPKYAEHLLEKYYRKVK